MQVNRVIKLNFDWVVYGVRFVVTQSGILLNQCSFLRKITKTFLVKLEVLGLFV